MIARASRGAVGCGDRPGRITVQLIDGHRVEHQRGTIAIRRDGADVLDHLRAAHPDAEIARLSIGHISLLHVPALVTKPGTLHENLLGMSFLDRLDSFTVSGDRLILKAK